MRYRKKQNTRKGIGRWRGAGALLLAVFLTSCGGVQTEESDGAPSGVVLLEDVGQSVADQTGTPEEPREADDRVSQTEGTLGGSEAGTPSQGQAEAASPSQGQAVPESAEPEMPAEPIKEVLKPEGIGWGLVFGDSGTQPAGNASPQELALYDAYFLNPGEEKVIYLTFDCGYENGNTGNILDALKAHDAPATFFVVGHFLETEPELVKRMVEEGHAVGNHTYHHYDIDTLDDESFQKELEDVENLFREITGTELSPYYRPPEGKCGTTNLKRAQELGYATCFWSLAHVDWDVNNQPTHQAALDKLTARVHPGAIVLLHNTSKTNGEILDELLTKWEEMGYTFAPLSELTQK